MSDVLMRKACDHRIGDPVEALIITACPRCNGTGFYNTLVFSEAGLQMLSPAYSLVQSLQKILIEKRRPSGYGFDYTLLRSVISSDTLGAIRAEASRCILYLQKIQQNEAARGFQFSNTELIDSIDAITATQDATEPRRVYILASVSTVSGRAVTINTSLKA